MFTRLPKAAFGTMLCGAMLTRAALVPVEGEPQLSRDRVAEYLTDDGRVLTARTPDEWESRRNSILQAMQSMMGSLPSPDKRCPLEVNLEEEADMGTYIRPRAKT